MNFKTDEASVQLLLALGLKETTEKVFPKSYARIQKEGYDPSSMKREFALNSKDYLTFNYLSVQGWGRFRFINGTKPDPHKIRLLFLLIKLYPRNRRKTADYLENKIRRITLAMRYSPLGHYDQCFWNRYVEVDREVRELLVAADFDVRAFDFADLLKLVF